MFNVYKQNKWFKKGVSAMAEFTGLHNNSTIDVLEPFLLSPKNQTACEF